jgi:hypothetical protein
MISCRADLFKMIQPVHVPTGTYIHVQINKLYTRDSEFLKYIGIKSIDFSDAKNPPEALAAIDNYVHKRLLEIGFHHSAAGLIYDEHRGENLYNVMDNFFKSMPVEMQTTVSEGAVYSGVYYAKDFYNAIFMHRKADLFKQMKTVPHHKFDKVKLSDLRKGVDEGRRVIYLPQHANGDWLHKDSEQGKISSWNHKFVFVNFGKGDTNPACDPNDLEWMFSYDIA